MNTSAEAVGRPSAGSRACRCRIAAPAFAAAIDCSAIWAGVNGRNGDMVGVCMLPVVAQLMMTLFAITSPDDFRYRYHLWFCLQLCESA